MRWGESLLLLPLVACAAGRGRSGSVGPGVSAGGPAALAAPAEPPSEIARASLGALSAAKWRLSNGLEVILMPDPSATSVSYMTWFKVGSRNEDEAAGQTGLAHLFEHLMFTQTKAGADGAFDRALEEVGGSANAMTYYDFTAYHDDLPPERAGPGGPAGGRSDVEPRSEAQAGRDGTRRGRSRRGWRRWKTASTACSTS